MKYHFIGGEIIPDSQALIPVFDLGLLRGYGVFDFFNVKQGVPMFLNEHLARFLNSARQVDLVCPYGIKELRKHIIELIAKNKMITGSMKVILTGGISSNGFDPDGPNRLMILAGDLIFPVTEEGDIHPFRLKTIDYVRETPGVKSLNYLVPLLHWKESKAAGFHDLLYVHDGWVSETSRANLFAVTYDNILITPSEKILGGVTRDHVIRLAKTYMPVEIRPLSLQEVLHCKSVFLTSTTKKIRPVSQIDEHVFSSTECWDPAGKLLQELKSMEDQYILEFLRHQE